MNLFAGSTSFDGSSDAGSDAKCTSGTATTPIWTVHATATTSAAATGTTNGRHAHVQPVSTATTNVHESTAGGNGTDTDTDPRASRSADGTPAEGTTARRVRLPADSIQRVATTVQQRSGKSGEWEIISGVIY